MPNGASHPEPTADTQLLVRCLESDGSARRALLDQLCAEHPDRASSLRRLYGLLDEFGLADEPAAVPDDDGAPTLALPERIGSYRIRELLGSGGMGVVYRAEHEGLGRQVALKLIHRPLAPTERARARFRREAALAARLDDPRICPVYEIGEAEDGMPYFAMRLVPGSTLAAAIASSRAAGSPLVLLPGRDNGSATTASGQLATLLQLVEETAKALDHAHERGLVHRDVKPGNVMVTPDGAPVLLDFGLAQSDDEGDAKLTQTGDQLGTPHYMAPEQITGGTIDRRTDVYALGVLLYECLTGRAPFEAPRRQDLAALIVSADLPDPRRTQRVIGRDLYTVLQTALAKVPAQRYATAAAFAEDLRRLRCREPILARRAGPLQRSLRFARRHPFAATLFAVLSTAVLVFAFLVDQRDATVEALRATAAARTAPDVALASALSSVASHRSVENVSALHEVSVLHHERLRLQLTDATWVALWSRDGDRLLMSSDDGQVRVLDARDGTQLARRGHNLRPGRGARAVGWLESAPLVPGRPERFASASDDGSARVFDRDGEQLLLLDHRTETNQTGGTGAFTDFFDPTAYPAVYRARWSHDGTRIATSCSDQHVRVWDATTGDLLCALPGHTTPMVEVAWSSTGVLASADNVQGWDAAGRTFSVQVWAPSGNGYTLAHRLEVPGSIHQLDFTVEGRTLVGACHDGHAYVWDMGRTEAPLRLRHGGPVWSVNLARVGDEPRLVTGSADRTVRIWSLAGDPLHVAHHDGEVLHVEFAGGNRSAGPLRVLSTSRDHTVRVFDAQLHPQFVLRGHRDLTYRAQLSPDGRQLASTSVDGSVRLWSLVDAETPRLVGHGGGVRGLTLLPDGRVLSVGDDREARVWDLATARARTFALPAVPHNIDASADGSTLLVGGEHGAVDSFDIATGAPVATYPSPNTQWAVGAWLPGGQALVAGRGSMQVFAGSDPQPWLNRDPALYALAVAAQRRVVAGVGRSGRVQLWDDAGRELGGTFLPDRLWATSVAFTVDEGQLAVGVHRAGEVLVWNVPAVATAEWPAPTRLTGHDGTVLAVAWSPSGRLLAASVSDGTSHLWDVARRERIAVLRGHGSSAVHAVCFVGEGLLLTGGGDGAIQGWQTSVGRQVQLATARLPKVVAVGGSANNWAFLLDSGRIAEGCREAEAMLADPAGRDAKFLWWMTARLVAPGRDFERHPQLLDLALRAATRCIEQAQPPDSAMLFTMGRVWFLKGDLAKAIEWQTKAVEATAAYRTHDRRRQEERLAAYRQLQATRR